MLSKTAKAYTEIQSCLTPLIEGSIVCIDPSIGSTSSQPGWAAYYRGELKGSGTFSIDPSLPVWMRLRKLVHQLRKLYFYWMPDVLVYEDIPSLRQGGGNANSHASLLKAVGAILSVSGPDYYVGLLPVSWKRMARSTYVKSDEADAVEIGYIAIEEAKRIQELDPPGRKYGKRPRGTSNPTEEGGKGARKTKAT